MEKGLFIHGIYPRSELLVAVSREYDRRRTNEDDLSTQQSIDRQRLVAAQEANGFTHIEDGKLTWQDMFRPFSQTTRGLSFEGGLTRWFDNNTFFRRPVISGELIPDFSKLDLFFPQVAETSQWKVTLPSPFTFARLSIDTTTNKPRETLENVTNLIKVSIEHLEERGVNFIQLNEQYIPYYGASKSNINELMHALRLLDVNVRTSKLAIHFPFGDAAPSLKHLEEEHVVDIIGADLLKTRVSDLPTKLSHGLIAGVVDGRNSLIETQKETAALIDKTLNHTQPQVIYISPNTDLEFVPEKIARKKLEVLGNVYKEI